MFVTFTEDTTQHICLSTNSHFFQRIGFKQISFGIYINVFILMMLRYRVNKKLSSGFLSTFLRLYTAQRIKYSTSQVNARFYSHVWSRMPVTDSLESQYQNVNVLKKNIFAYHFTTKLSFVYSADQSSTTQLTLHDSALTHKSPTK